MMKKLKIIWTLVVWLYQRPHPNGVKAVVNVKDGEEWFMVDREFISIPYEQLPENTGNPEVVIDGKRYIQVGGGDQSGKYVYIGEA
jgi:hypothetical protein